MLALISIRLPMFGDKKQKLRQSVERQRSKLLSSGGEVVELDRRAARSQQLAQCANGEAIELVHDPSDRFDKFAVKALRDRGAPLGYLRPGKVTFEVWRRLKQGDHLHAVVEDITNRGVFSGGERRVAIRITNLEFPDYVYRRL